MTIYYSPSTKGFYDDNLKSDYQNNNSWPEDLIEISEQWYNYLLQKQSEGKTINTNEYGQPVVVDPTPLTQDELIEQLERQKSRLLAEAESVIFPLERAVRLNMATDEERSRLEAWERYSVLVSRVDTANPEWPDKPE
ncbi:tail fiber assembly protein (plasmid) [Escherichia marmotae]|uniref:tail fiber assembly protein n=1 Tax=Escherichia marmotae TaxID=1499973 RepID=UPI00384D8E32